MNKLLLIPITFILLLSILSLVYVATPSELEGEADWDTGGELIQNGNATELDIPGAKSQLIEINLGEIEMAMILLTIAIAVGIVSGIRILGSGLTIFSQLLIFKGAIFLGLWAIFSILAFNLISNAGTLGYLIWLILTIMYVIGFGMHIGGGDVD